MLLRISHSFGLKLVMAMTKSNRRFRTYNSDLGKITIDYDTFVSFDSKDINKEKNMTMLRINERSKVMDDWSEALLDPDNPKYTAALQLHKVYKSFRTRTKLADYTILIEQSWYFIYCNENLCPSLLNSPWVLILSFGFNTYVEALTFCRTQAQLYIFLQHWETWNCHFQLV